MVPDLPTTPYEGVDPKDWHVVTSAIAGGAAQIVTFNLLDFPEEALRSKGTEAIHPQQLLLKLYELEPAVVLLTLQGMAARADRGLPEMLARIAWNAPGFALHVAEDMQIDLPTIHPRDWRR